MNRQLSQSLRGWPVPMAAAFVLLGVTALVVAVGALQYLATRGSSPEFVVRQYFQALERGDVETALAQIEPRARAPAQRFVENNVRNRYAITGIAVQQPSLLARIRGQGNGAHSVTVFLDITQAVGGERWQAAPKVPLVEADGRWYLGAAPLREG